MEKELENEELVSTTDDSVDNDEPTPNLTLNDLANIANLIEVSVQRGAFRANEVKAVGEVYENLTKFIQYIAQAQNNKGSIN